MLEAGVIVRLVDGRAQVLMQRNSACAECGKCHAMAHESRELMLDAANQVGAGLGDLVKVKVPDVGVVKASFLVYGLPMIAAVLGGAVGWAARGFLAGGSAEVGTTIGGVAGFAGALYWVSRYDRRMRRTWEGPTVVEVLHSGGTPAAPPEQVVQ